MLRNEQDSTRLVFCLGFKLYQMLEAIVSHRKVNTLAVPCLWGHSRSAPCDCLWESRAHLNEEKALTLLHASRGVVRGDAIYTVVNKNLELERHNIFVGGHAAAKDDCKRPTGCVRMQEKLLYPRLEPTASIYMVHCAFKESAKEVTL